MARELVVGLKLNWRFDVNAMQANLFPNG